MQLTPKVSQQKLSYCSSVWIYPTTMSPKGGCLPSPRGFALHRCFFPVWLAEWLRTLEKSQSLHILTSISLLKAHFTWPAELASAGTKIAAQHFRVWLTPIMDCKAQHLCCLILCTASFLPSCCACLMCSPPIMKGHKLAELSLQTTELQLQTLCCPMLVWSVELWEFWELAVQLVSLQQSAASCVCTSWRTWGRSRAQSGLVNGAGAIYWSE